MKNKTFMDIAMKHIDSIGTIKCFVFASIGERGEFFSIVPYPDATLDDLNELQKVLKVAMEKIKTEGREIIQ